MITNNSLNLLTRYPSFDNITGTNTILLVPNDQVTPPPQPVFTNLGTLTLTTDNNKTLIQGTVSYYITLFGLTSGVIMFPITVLIKVFNGTNTTPGTEIKTFIGTIHEALLAPRISGNLALTSSQSFHFIVDSNSSTTTTGDSVYTVTTELHEYLFSNVFVPQVYLLPNYEIIATELAETSAILPRNYCSTS